MLLHTTYAHFQKIKLGDMIGLLIRPMTTYNLSKGYPPCAKHGTVSEKQTQRPTERIEFAPLFYLTAR